MGASALHVIPPSPASVPRRRAAALPSRSPPCLQVLADQVVGVEFHKKPALPNARLVTDSQSRPWR